MQASVAYGKSSICPCVAMREQLTVNADLSPLLSPSQYLSTVISSACLCLLQRVFHTHIPPHSCWIIKKCFDSQNDLESGAAALSSSAVALACVFLFSLFQFASEGFLSLSHTRRFSSPVWAWFCTLHTQMFHLTFCSRGSFFFRHSKPSAGTSPPSRWLPPCAIPHHLHSGQRAGEKKKTEWKNFLTHDALVAGSKLALGDGLSLLKEIKESVSHLTLSERTPVRLESPCAESPPLSFSLSLAISLHLSLSISRHLSFSL